MDILNLLKLDYWFSKPFSATGTTLWLFVGGFLAMIAAGMVLRILMQKSQDNIQKKVYKKISNLGFVMGMWGLVWMFFRQERAYLLGWRFWLLAWLGVFAWWSYKIIMFVFKRVPVIKMEQEKKQRIEKYLPGH